MKAILSAAALLLTASHLAAQVPNPPPSTTPTNNPVAVGAGSYLTNWDGRIDAAIPDNRDVQATKHITTNLANQPMPTNSWWSSILWAGVNDPWQDWGTRGSHNVSYAHPFAIKPELNGVRLYSPRQEDFWAIDYAFVGTMPAPATQWINGVEHPMHETVYFKELDFVLGNTAASGNFSAKVHDYSDWFVTTRMEAGAGAMDLTFGHGSPYVFANYTNGNPTISFASHSTAPVAAKTPEVWSGTSSSAVIGFSVQGRNYAAFAPAGTSWTGLGTSKITANLPAGKKYFSVAALPNRAALTLMTKYAYNHVTGSQVSWNYRASDSKLLSTYAVTTNNYAESTGTGTLMGLYPHQWRKLASGATLTGESYFTPRGSMKLAQGSSFTTAITYQGVIPAMPALTDAADKTRLSTLVNNVRNETFTHRDTYYTGKRLGKVASLIPLAQQTGNTAAATQFKDELKWRLEGWLKADVIDDLEPSPFAKNLFYYNSNWGTLLGIDGSFGSLKELNDHHFHYGYFVRAAAELARNDKNWAQPQQFGGMIELLMRDYGNWERPRNPATSATGKMFPFLRNFDIYAGHSWASGHARFGAGNNNESSSEAMNAWTAMILWGEETGNTAVRDAGIFLYTTEMTAIQEYWNNVYGTNYHPTYTKPMASLVWGGKTDYATWFSGQAEAMHGIILLPIQSGSLYLGQFPDYAKTNFDFMANGRTMFTMWDAIFYAYQAVYDPATALANFNANEGRMRNSIAGPACATEEGNSLANTYAWIKTFHRFGRIDNQVVATNHASFAVFRTATERTYVAYNASATDAKNVTFNDGTSLLVSPGELKVYTSVAVPVSSSSAPSSTSASSRSSASSLSTQSSCSSGFCGPSSISSSSRSSSSMPSSSRSSSSKSSSSMSSASVASSSVAPVDLGVVKITPMPFAAVKFSVRLNERKQQVHLFARRNGAQDFVVIDLQAQAGAEVNNGDGTYTYQTTRTGAAYGVGDLIEARFYSFAPASGQLFLPGPGENSWTSLLYNPVSSSAPSSTSSSRSSVPSSVSSSSRPSSLSSASSSSLSGYSANAVMPNGAPVAYTTTATYANGGVKITFTTNENINWAWCFTPGWNNMTRVVGNSFEVTIPNVTPGSAINYYFTVNTATRGEANNNNQPHQWMVQ
ncbi:MAG: glycosyl hydrolase [Cellvibrio sp.]|uniref:glycosyl hydrolase n=1 Tax=Cellvibrio sp. TaxID=1965322 RepID=UPI002719ACD8|nr:glycosyl hydrolase [Cellvibrio sp.]